MTFLKTLVIVSLLTSFGSMAKAAAKFQKVESATVSQWLNAKTSGLYLLDANNTGTRKEYGTVPGAKLLPSYSKYNVAQELPQDKDAKLVFFCANEQCSASHKAAEKAMSSGYKNVYVMTDGIMGWKKNGFPTKSI